MIKKERQPTEFINEHTFGTRLAAAMEMSGDTKSSLARKSGLSEAAIRGYLKHESSPSIVQLTKLAKATGVNASWFLGEDGGKKESVGVEDDIALLTMLFRHISETQRHLVIVQAMSALSSQYANSTADTLLNLSPSIIDIALKINSLSTEQRQKLQDEFGIEMLP
ncbi:helix-turn-helix domain-containing protein [Cedecea sp. NFIX57]|uniref:helix-turn-helix domain-containing protein n=1 Tax=Cedecea sp. NFIX57 TaxID=1566286 RepID=UPI000A09E0AB|nr:helix-turn-helix transcriptional regulator [Cedecea sp. NFIX57]SMG56955.1 Helix-turn-helix [Cedecea sp. NFIX57]